MGTTTAVLLGIIVFTGGVITGMLLSVSSFCKGYVEQKARNAWAIRQAKEGL